MKGSAVFRATTIALLIVAGANAPVEAQASNAGTTSDSMYATISALDSALFDAYNRCDLKSLDSYFTDDLEFYHDQSGLSRGKPALMRDLRKYVCGKVRRDRVAGTLEVNPLRGYGAVQTGLHLFCDATKYHRCEDATSGVAKYVHVWRHTAGAWQISRVISYDHVSSREPAVAR
jgi:ketosteroid isomerase-like protein